MSNQKLRSYAENLRKRGDGEDKILAHINPEEAEMLGRNYGYDINPETGLPQFGFFKKLLKAVPMVLGGALGGMVAGPAGAALGGGLGGSMTRGKDNKMEGFGQGAMSGLGQHFGGQMGSSMSNGSNPFGNYFGGGQGGGFNPMSMIQGMMGGGQGQQPGFGGMDMMFPGGNAYDIQRQGLSQYAPSFGLKDEGFSGAARNFRNPNNPLEVFQPNLESSKTLFDIAKEKMLTDAKKKKRYAAGGHVRAGNTCGTADDIEVFIPDRSHVITAMEVAALGDGNTEAGIKKLKDFEDSFTRSGITKESNITSKGIRAYVSNGEYIIGPKTVKAIGKGSADKGEKIIEKMRKNLRVHKGIKHVLAPKAKDIKIYMTGRE